MARAGPARKPAGCRGPTRGERAITRSPRGEIVIGPGVGRQPLRDPALGPELAQPAGVAARGDGHHGPEVGEEAVVLAGVADQAGRLLVAEAALLGLELLARGGQELLGQARQLA